MTQEQIDNIKLEAENKYPKTYLSWGVSYDDNWCDIKRSTYIEAVTPYASKLEEAEREITRLKTQLNKTIEESNDLAKVVSEAWGVVVEKDKEIEILSAIAQANIDGKTEEEKKELRANVKFDQSELKKTKEVWAENMIDNTELKNKLEKEIERLKSLARTTYDYAICDLPDDERNKLWEQFKTENQL